MFERLVSIPKNTVNKMDGIIHPFSPEHMETITEFVSGYGFGVTLRKAQEDIFYTVEGQQHVIHKGTPIGTMHEFKPFGDGPFEKDVSVPTVLAGLRGMRAFLEYIGDENVACHIAVPKYLIASVDDKTAIFMEDRLGFCVDEVFEEDDVYGIVGRTDLVMKEFKERTRDGLLEERLLRWAKWKDPQVWSDETIAETKVDDINVDSQPDQEYIRRVRNRNVRLANNGITAFAAITSAALYAEGGYFMARGVPVSGAVFFVGGTAGVVYEASRRIRQRRRNREDYKGKTEEEGK